MTTLKIKGVIWLDTVVGKLAFKHNVRSVEVEEALSGKPKFRFLEKGERKGEDVSWLWGGQKRGAIWRCCLSIKRLARLC